MTTTPRPSLLRHLPRRRFGQLLPWGGLALLAACSKRTEPAATMPADPAPAPSAAPVPTTAPEAAAPAPVATASASAGLPMVDPADPAVAPLAYMADASQVVAANNPKFQPGQACNNCALYGGRPGDAAGPCPLYAGRQVSAKAWCNAYTRKAG